MDLWTVPAEEREAGEKNLVECHKKNLLAVSNSPQPPLAQGPRRRAENFDFTGEKGPAPIKSSESTS